MAQQGPGADVYRRPFCETTQIEAADRAPTCASETRRAVPVATRGGEARSARRRPAAPLKIRLLKGSAGSNPTFGTIVCGCTGRYLRSSLMRRHQPVRLFVALSADSCRHRARVFCALSGRKASFTLVGRRTRSMFHQSGDTPDDLLVGRRQDVRAAIERQADCRVPQREALRLLPAGGDKGAE